METQQKVILLFGGRSTEHEVSCRSAWNILNSLKKSHYHVQCIGIDKEGMWWWQEEARPNARQDSLMIERSGTDGLIELIKSARSYSSQPPVVFCIVHGNDGEDGHIQALCEMLNLPFVGTSSLSSAIGMDKVVSKQLVEQAGVPIVPYLTIRLAPWQRNREIFCQETIRVLGEDLFVKPVKGGSSVGIHHVRRGDDLGAAVDDAFRYHDEVLIEKTMIGREIEIAALGDYEPMLSQAGEIIMQKPGDFYDYNNKYSENSAAEVKVPADLSANELVDLRAIANKCFQALRLYGMARLDFFYVVQEKKFYFNEVNTIPGFTSISQYPKLWELEGIKAKDLMDRLIELALRRWKLESLTVKII